MNRDELSEIYEEYLAEAVRAESERKPGEGRFGIGKTPADDPCHASFAEKLEAWLGAFLRTDPDSGAVRGVLEEVYRAPKAHPEPRSAYWMLIAVQGLTAGLISRLSREDAAALTAEYAAAYKRYERMPVQKQLFAALKKAANTEK